MTILVWPFNHISLKILMEFVCNFCPSTVILDSLVIYGLQKACVDASDSPRFREPTMGWLCSQASRHLRV